MKVWKVLILIVGISIGFSVLAQTVEEKINLDTKVEAKDLEIKEPTLLPDNPFYFLKDLMREIECFFAFDPLKKLQLRSKIANEKLIEVKMLIEAKRGDEVVKKAIENYQNEIEKIKKEAEKIKQRARENPKIESFLEKFADQETLHLKLLDSLKEKVPPKAFEKIKEARERHLERFKDVMIKLEDRAEKIAEKINNALEKHKGSEFKEFKDLEALKEIEEKMPADVKEKIEKKINEKIEKFREKLEKMAKEKKEEFGSYAEKIAGDKLKQIGILSQIEAEEISEKLKDIIEKAKEKGIEKIVKLEISAEKAKEMIEKAEKEIAKAQEKVAGISEEIHGGRAAKRLLENAKRHVTEAKKAFDEGKYGKAFGLANAAFNEAKASQGIVERMEEIKKSPERIREKMRQLYPGIRLPDEVERCEIPLMKRCEKGETMIVEKDEKGCPIFKCKKIEKLPEKPEFCPQLWDPVCGKDGKTYPNECFAKMAGVEIDYRGICKIEARPLPQRILPE